MRRIIGGLVALCLTPAWQAVGAPATGGPAAPVHHRLEVRLDPGAHRLEVEDTIVIGAPDTPLFLLHAGLAPAIRQPDLSLERLSELPAPESFGLASYPEDVPLEAYRVTGENGAPVDELTLTYGGEIHHPLRESAEEYARAFSETPGTIEDEGVYLSGATFWYPVLGPRLVSFDLAVETGPGWDAVSEGKRSYHLATDEGTRVVWSAPEPGEEIHLVAGPFTVFEDRVGAVATYAYLRQDDEALARKYLDVTGRYLRMYESLLGPYPYAKFALVENFWETGYGMPSFTLLGPKVIRLPFILHSSYPHEILHNWWGNGVFVAWDEGNWCEGLTAYLADHLIKEQRGEGTAYRRDLLQKYVDYVREGRDFPLTAFRSRHSAATEAVGYGKTAMLFHMLRRRLGDDVFVDALRAFYEEHRFRRASWDDLRASFESASGERLGSFFHTWVEREGAPDVRIVQATATDGPADPDGRGEAPFGMRLELAQEGPVFPAAVEADIVLESGAVVTGRIALDGRRAVRGFDLEEPAAGVRVDPGYDVFRRLDPSEIPPSLGRAFGAPRVLMVLPSSAPDALLGAYRELAASWAETPSADVRITADDAVETLPADRATWILGWENRHRPVVEAGLAGYEATLSSDGFTALGEEAMRDARSVVAAVRHPDDPTLAVAFLATVNAGAMPGLGRKLPHYGKYGYLAFQGDEPTNVMKGQWPVVGSPLQVAFGEDRTLPPATPPDREPLAVLPPAYSERAMREDVALLASDDLAGRGCGSAGLARAADFIEKRMREAGLAPGAEDGGYRQAWTGPCGEDGEPATMVNLVGVLPGRRDDWSAQSVVVVAHYDHLGLGWPDPREGERGRIHNGADDNASGVAVLLELARVLADSLEPDRSIVFLAVSGEESGLRGSGHYVTSATRYPAGEIIGALNLDTVGRLEGRAILTLGAGSATEWVHIVRGAGYVTGVPAEAVMDDLGASDQKPFLDAGIPAVQFFTGPHLDYHRSSDDADKLDYPGMVKVAGYVREFVEYLAAREEPLTSTLTAASAGRPAATGRQGRRVSLGSVPDFAFEGPGYRLSGVTPGSPAEKAGLREGDVIVALDGAPIEGLRDVSAVLKSRRPGDRVVVAFERDGERREIEVELVGR